MELFVMPMVAVAVRMSADILFCGCDVCPKSADVLMRGKGTR